MNIMKVTYFRIIHQYYTDFDELKHSRDQYRLLKYTVIKLRKKGGRIKKDKRNLILQSFDTF
jgi:hypothetical protein